MSNAKPIRPYMRPRLQFVMEYWRVTPTGVWKFANAAERAALTAAHQHAQKLNTARAIELCQAVKQSA